MRVTVAKGVALRKGPHDVFHNFADKTLAMPANTVIGAAN